MNIQQISELSTLSYPALSDMIDDWEEQEGVAAPQKLYFAAYISAVRSDLTAEADEIRRNALVAPAEYERVLALVQIYRNMLLVVL